MDWKKHLFEQITLNDVYTWLEESDIYRELSTIGDELYPATQYGNAFIIEGDPVSTAYMRVIRVGYTLGVASFMQLEHTLHLVKGSNLEYAMVITLRSMVELAGRVHKAVRMLNEKSTNEFVKGSKRLTARFVPGGGGGFNVMTLVQSLSDEIPDIMEQYKDMSEYLHGDVLWHSVYRRVTFFSGQVHLPDDATEEEVMNIFATRKPSPIFQRYDQLIGELRRVLLADLEVVRTLAAPFSKRYLEHQRKRTGQNSSEED